MVGADKQSVYFAPHADAQQWVAMFSEGRPIDLSVAPPPNVFSTSSSTDSVIDIAFGSLGPSAELVAWVTTSEGEVATIEANHLSLLDRSSLGVTIAACTSEGYCDRTERWASRPSSNCLLVATTQFDSDEGCAVSEVLRLRYTFHSKHSPGRSGGVTASGTALFRLKDRVEVLRIHFGVLNHRDDSRVLAEGSPDRSTDGDPSDRRQQDSGPSDVLLSISAHGNVDVWDLTEEHDVTERFGNLTYDTEQYGAPTCAVVVSDALWIGTLYGPVIAIDLTCRREAVGDSLVVMKHHAGAVRSLMVMALGKRVWSCCEDGEVAVWSTARRKPCGVFEMQKVALHSIAAASPQLTTMVWGVDALHGLRCWEVKESTYGHCTTSAPRACLQLQPGGGGAAAIDDAERTLHESHHFLKGLCRMLSEPSAVSDGLVVPQSVDVLAPEVRYLPDALGSLAECREMIRTAFDACGWESRSLSEDVRRLTTQSQRSHRVKQRAHHLAQRLSSLTSFPLSDDVDDPLERLVTSAECVLEEVADRGFVADPNRPEAPMYPSDMQKLQPSSQHPLDDSLPPVAETMSTHVFETQLQALQDQVDQHREEKRKMTDTMLKLERELAREQQQLRDSSDDNGRLSDEVDRLKKAITVQKKKLQSVQEDADEQRASSAKIHDELRRQLKQAQGQLEASQAKVQAKGDSDSNAVVAEKDRLIEDLLRFSKNLNAKCEAIRHASLEVIKELQQTNETFAKREAIGTSVVKRLQANQHEALELVVELRTILSRGAVRTSSPEGERALQCIERVVQILAGPPTRPPPAKSQPQMPTPRGNAAGARKAGVTAVPAASSRRLMM